MSPRARRVALKLLIEYILVTLPILVYVLLEAFAQDNPLFFFTSPEWSIATIFLTLQMIRICLEGLRDVTGRLLNHLLLIALVTITLCGGVNIYVSLQAAPPFLSFPMIVKWSLFAIATALFVYVAGAAIYVSEPRK
jgi:hypothetical protein